MGLVLFFGGSELISTHPGERERERNPSTVSPRLFAPTHSHSHENAARTIFTPSVSLADESVSVTRGAEGLPFPTESSVVVSHSLSALGTKETEEAEKGAI